MKIGEWIGVTEDGIWFCPWDSEKHSWSKKSELIEDIGNAYLDIRNKPKVKRICTSEYEYTVKDVDTGHDGEIISIYRLTNENFERFNQLLQDTLENDY